MVFGTGKGKSAAAESNASRSAATEVVTTEADALNAELRDAVRELTAALGKFAEAIPDADTVFVVKELLQRHAAPVVHGPAGLSALRAIVALLGALSVLGQELRPLGARVEAILERVA